MDIREIEKIVDEEHKKCQVFNKGKEQTFFDILSSFEDCCGLILMGSVLNPFALKKITNQMDALNIALIWANELCSEDDAPLNTYISEARYEKCCKLLCDYAQPYSMICSGYISYSRKRFEVEIGDKNVTFKLCQDQNNSVWSDIIRESSEVNMKSMAKLIDPCRLLNSINEIKTKVKVEDDSICYCISKETISAYKEISRNQWEATSTLPSDWIFDSFSLADYKAFWISITALCYIHFCSCFAIQDPLIRLKNSVIIQKRDDIVQYIESESGISREKIDAIIRYITFDARKKNVDIMYQPIVAVSKDMLIITPVLFMGSKPERNLLSVISTMQDYEYSREVNNLEGLMVSELESCVSSSYIARHKHLRKDLPDIDFAVYDKTSNSALICETKWFAAADSTKEVYAKEDEITHGCSQIESIMAYAMNDKKSFIKQVFQIDTEDPIDLFCCVVAKNNIRSQNNYVPVIDMKRIKELLSMYSLNSVFHMIRNHEYELPLPTNASITYQSVCYAGYEFRIPAICFGTATDDVENNF